MEQVLESVCFPVEMGRKRDVALPQDVGCDAGGPATLTKHKPIIQEALLPSIGVNGPQKTAIEATGSVDTTEGWGRRIKCEGDPGCVFPGPLCLHHWRMANEPMMFMGQTTAALLVARATMDLGVSVAKGNAMGGFFEYREHIITEYKRGDA